MSYAHSIPKEIKVRDRFGDTRIIRQTPNGLKLKRQSLTPVIALNQAVAKVMRERIHARRLARGWTLAECAERAGLRGGKQRMYEIETTERASGREFGTIYALALAFGCEATDLMPTIVEIESIAMPQHRTVVALR